MGDALPFHALVLRRGRRNVVAGLVAAGHDINGKDERGRTAVICALHHKDFGMVLELVKYGASLVSPLGGAEKEVQGARGPLAFGPSELMRAALAQGLDPNALDDEHKSVLVRAAEALGRDTTDGIRQLVWAGADIDRAGWDGWTPLMSALHSDELDRARLLLQMGANPARDTFHDPEYMGRGWAAVHRILTILMYKIYGSRSRHPELTRDLVAFAEARAPTMAQFISPSNCKEGTWVRAVFGLEDTMTETGTYIV